MRWVVVNVFFVSRSWSGNATWLFPEVLSPLFLSSGFSINILCLCSYAKNQSAPYPVDDTQYISPAISILNSTQSPLSPSSPSSFNFYLSSLLSFVPAPFCVSTSMLIPYRSSGANWRRNHGKFQGKMFTKVLAFIPFTSYHTIMVPLVSAATFERNFRRPWQCAVCRWWYCCASWPVRPWCVRFPTIPGT